MIRNEARFSRRPWPDGQRATLTEINNKLSENGNWLHATKGFRYISDKRAQAIAFVAEIKARIFRTPNKPKPSRYMPHQGKQECFRRLANIGKAKKP